MNLVTCDILLNSNVKCIIMMSFLLTYKCCCYTSQRTHVHIKLCVCTYVLFCRASSDLKHYNLPLLCPSNLLMCWLMLRLGWLTGWRKEQSEDLHLFPETNSFSSLRLVWFTTTNGRRNLPRSTIEHGNTSQPSSLAMHLLK